MRINQFFYPLTLMNFNFFKREERIFSAKIFSLSPVKSFDFAAFGFSLICFCQRASLIIL